MHQKLLLMHVHFSNLIGLETNVTDKYIMFIIKDFVAEYEVATGLVSFE